MKHESKMEKVGAKAVVPWVKDSWSMTGSDHCHYLLNSADLDKCTKTSVKFQTNNLLPELM